MKNNFLPIVVAVATGALLLKKNKGTSGVGSIEDEYYAYRTAYALMKKPNVFKSVLNMLDHPNLFSKAAIDSYLWDVILSIVDMRIPTKKQAEKGTRLFIMMVDDVRKFMNDFPEDVTQNDLEDLRKSELTQLEQLMAIYF